VRRWIDGDVDDRDKTELSDALDRGDLELLQARFSARLSFGTAGLRGVIGAGPGAMNCAVIRQTCHGIADVIDAEGGDKARGVVIGFDARRRSRQFATDAAGVLRARGVAVFLWDHPTPTPATPFWLRRLGALAGFQVTASHNPPQDNGFKVFWHHGAQIIPPVDAQIAAAIAIHAAQRACDLAILPPSAAGPALGHFGVEERRVYEQAVAATCPGRSDPSTPFSIAYTALHGVGGASVRATLEQAGFTVSVVHQQFAPDGNFPTVAFPNPEEDGAMDLALALGARCSADLIIANDPDADRLAVAVPEHGQFRLLNGNEIGILLADHCMRHAEPGAGLVVNSVVSSQALAALATSYGFDSAQALTGFKWIMAEARRAAPTPFIFGYEEALGYCVGELVADKDGISAALAFAELARGLKAAGSSVLDQLDAIYAKIGVFVSECSVARFAGPEAQQLMRAAVQRIRQATPTTVAGLGLQQRADYAQGAPWDASLRADMIALDYGGDGERLRVLIRPSGTEPKVKTYFEYTAAVSVDAARARLAVLNASWQDQLQEEGL
jgi:phosphomannomutase